LKFKPTHTSSAKLVEVVPMMIAARYGYHEPPVRNRATAQIFLMNFFDGYEGIVLYNLKSIPLGGYIRIWTTNELRPWFSKNGRKSC